MQQLQFWSAIMGLVVAAQPAGAEASYQCLTEQTVGFAFDVPSRRWTPAHFGGGQSFRLRSVVTADLEDPQVGEMVRQRLAENQLAQVADDLLFLAEDNPVPLATCREFGSTTAPEILCHPWTGLVQVDLHSMKFAVSYLGSYATAHAGTVSGLNVPPDPAFVGFGRCSVMH